MDGSRYYNKVFIILSKQINFWLKYNILPESSTYLNNDLLINKIKNEIMILIDSNTDNTKDILL